MLNLTLPEFRQSHCLLILLFTLTFFSFVTYAQPEFSAAELRLVKEKKSYSNAVKYHLPQDKFPMPEITVEGNTIFADGDLDSTFNASVTEGFGYVNKTVIQTDGKIIAVGLFQRANGTRTNGIARFNADGTLDTSFNGGSGANAAIRAVALQADGKILIGGAFTSFNGQPVNRLARLNPDGSIDPTFSLTVAFNNQINDLLILSGGKILVGGQFTLSSTRLVRLNADGTLDTAISGFNNTVFVIANAPSGKILVGGQFSLPEPNIARLNADGTLDTVFNPTTGGSGYPVFNIAVQTDGKIIASGAFTTFNGTPTDGLVRLNDNGTVDAAFEITNDPNVSSLEVHGLAIQPDGKILAGFFDNDTGIIADVKRFNTDTTIDNSFATNTGNLLAAVDLNLLSSGKILAGGYFVTLNNEPRLRLVRLNANGAVDNSFTAALSTFGTVYAIERQADGKIVIGGDFEYINGVKRGQVVRLNADGSLDSGFTLGAGMFGDVFSLAIQPDGKIVIGGLFAGDNNFPAFSVARLNPNGSFDINLNNTTNFVNVAYALAIQPDGKIVIGGVVFDVTFQTIALNRVLSNGNWDSAFNSPILPTGTVRDILIQPSGKIIIGGTFFPLGGGTLQRNGIARLNGSDGSLDSAFSAFVGNVYSLKQTADNKVLAGGFTLTRFSSEGVVDTTLNVGTGFNNLIRAVEVQADGKILLGGGFTFYNGISVNRLIRINDVGAFDSSFNASPSGSVLALFLQNDGKILVGGQFLDFNGTEKFSLVRLLNSAIRRAAPFDFDGDTKTDISIFRSSVAEWWYQCSSDGQVPAAQFGNDSDKIVPADYSGDGKADIAIWRPSTGEWFILRSEDGSFYSVPFGTSGDIPAPSDFDGDNKADLAVFRPSGGTWFINRSSGGTDIINFGQNGDVPAVGDYDGDGRADIAIFRPSDGQWWLNRSTAGVVAATFGTSGDKPVAGDWTGDGKTDIAFWRPSTGEWFILRSEDSSFYSVPFGASGDVPAPGDYDGDGKFDTAVFRPSGATWYVNRSTAGLLIQQFGLAADTPVPSAYVP
jgi:uncharacterized delta-60 repeat protein